MRGNRRHRFNRYGGGHFFKRHFSRSRFDDLSRRGFYRSRNGIIFGVCRGIAEYFDFSVFWVRFISIVLFFFTGFWPTAVIYFVAAFLMNPEPIIPLENMEEREFYDSYARSREMAADRIKRRYENLERRIQRLEHSVTRPGFDWEKRLNSEA
ncbi:envelope stress response membrane protein PspC [Deltaproteobacteria bacterium]|nr:envelope stress response membrane protein PspC [Deltaproteobacteria bacterium]